VTEYRLNLRMMWPPTRSEVPWGRRVSLGIFDLWQVDDVRLHLDLPLDEAVAHIAGQIEQVVGFRPCGADGRWSLERTECRGMPVGEPPWGQDNYD
jgi:hypothetical protein